ncbi:MAG: CCA tRNA nucleotidyltransferase [Clostridia bacterium]|nr:CCA tRNA nucleotidyltransferase [Clostridia bacterium]
MNSNYKNDKNIEMSERIAREVARRGGCAYFVGGFVRDMLMGRSRGKVKDVDIEVHGLGPEELERLLGTLGEVTSMGASFGVFSLRHYHIDIAMPRTEHATGRGHKDFTVFVDPFIGAENAARRRDFTVNALMQNVLTGEVLDYFGGKQDLERGILRHVNDESFVEDPLRAFRGAQFAARFGFEVAPETIALCSRMDVSALSTERVFGETEKALMQSGAPGVYFEVLSRMRQLECWFPEVQTFIEGPGNDGGDRAGSVAPERLAQISALLKTAAAMRGKASDPEGFMCGALTLALGGNTAWLRRLTANRKLRAYSEIIAAVAPEMVKYAADKVHFPDDRTKIHEAERMELLDRGIPAGDVLKMARAVLKNDKFLLPELLKRGDKQAIERENRELAALYAARDALPAVTGKDLTDNGLTPGPDFARGLKYGRALQLAGVDKPEALRRVLKLLREDE